MLIRHYSDYFDPSSQLIVQYLILFSTDYLIFVGAVGTDPG